MSTCTRRCVATTQVESRRAVICATGKELKKTCLGVIVRCDDHATVACVLVEKTSRCQFFNVNGTAAKTRPKVALALKASRQAGEQSLLRMRHTF